MTDRALTPIEAVAHLEPKIWEAVNRGLVAKALAELAHERLVVPEPLHTEADWVVHRVALDEQAIEYRFRARQLKLNHFWIDRGSLRKLMAGRDAPLDALAMIHELRAQLSIPPEVLPGYLQELAATLYSAAFKLTQPGLTAAELARADFQSIETARLEGHPIFIANNGRIGFNAHDYRAYAPEAAEALRLVWLAASRARVEIACVDDLTYSALVEAELGAAQRSAFAHTLEERRLDPAAYVFLPVHPWQWRNRIAQLFAADIARGDLVYLGESADRYLAQQSIRTLFNVSSPGRCYVKTSLSILNMGFTRGISASIVQGSAAINDWVSRLVEQDDYLQRLGYKVLREVAFIGYRHAHYELAVRKRSHPYREMLAAVWRENPLPKLQPQQRLMTMSALMHIDCEGSALLPALIEASGIGMDAWLRLYLHAYLKPLVHCFYAHNLVFTPHCENSILILEEFVPVGLIIKDIAEDVGVLNPEVELPNDVRRLALQVPDELMTLSIFTDVFDCVFRFLAQIVLEHTGYPEEKFWRCVADCIREYQADQPQLAAKFQRWDLFAPTFALNCLNRLQLRNNEMMVDLNAEHPVDSLQFAGSLENPIAVFAAAEVSR